MLLNSQILQEEDIEPLIYYFAAKLPPKTREIFLMSRMSDKSYKEIALDQQISVKTVEAHMSKALKIMRATLKNHGFFSVLVFLEYYPL